VNGSDGGLHLIRAGPPMAQRLLHEHERLVDHLPIPEFAILIIEQHDLVVAIEPCAGARML
jgi:hypothetical protein